MIRLDSTLRKLQAVLGGAITTNQLPVTVCYSDKTSTTYTGGATVTNTNSTTAVDIVAAPAASTVRDIDTINVQNADTVAATITIRYNDNGTTYTIFKVLLAVGDQLTYIHGVGWHVLDSNGAIKNLSPSNYKLSAFAPTTSAELATVISDETGSGLLVFATSPTLVTPILGVATATSINKVAITAPATSATLTIADGKTLTASNSLTLAGTDATVLTFPSTSATIARTDAAQTFTGAQTFSNQIVSTMSNNAVLFNAASATTGYQMFNLQNTGAQVRFGMESSAGGSQLPGSSAYSGFLGNVSNTDFHLFTNNTIRGTFSSTGLAVTGTLSTTSTITGSSTPNSFGAGGTGATYGTIIANGGSASTGGPLLQLSRNSVAKGYLGTISAISGNNSDDIGLSTSVLAQTWSGANSTIAGNLTVSGTGPHAIGGATESNRMLAVRGTFAGSVAAFGLTTDLLTLTAPANGTAALAYFGGTIVEAASGTHADFASLLVDAPTITGGAAALTNASTLKITGAPTGATNNRALWVVAGGVSLGAANATGATTGYLSIPTSAGAPTGVPADPATGTVALQFDTTNNRLYVYDGAWLSVALA